MPVIDHPVHETVKEGSSAKYGCWNKKRNIVHGYFVQVRIYDADGTYKLIDQFVRNQGSLECRYDMSLKDTKCHGCKSQGFGEAYDSLIRMKGK